MLGSRFRTVLGLLCIYYVVLVMLMFSVFECGMRCSVDVMIRELLCWWWYLFDHVVL